MDYRSTPLAIGTAGSTTATVFGVLAGLGGITHGVGEVLQGSVPTGFWIASWTSGPIAEKMGGEPGFTVLPTALAAGVATLAFSTAVVTWSAAGARRRHGGLVLILLSTGMLLAGGGVGPPLIGILGGAAGVAAAGRAPRWLRRLPPRARRLLARSWPPLFAIAAANAAFLVVGSVVLVYGVGLDAPGLFLGSFYFSVLSLLALIIAGAARDAERIALVENGHRASSRRRNSVPGEA
jgi:hypothetical protein